MHSSPVFVTPHTPVIFLSTAALVTWRRTFNKSIKLIAKACTALEVMKMLRSSLVSYVSAAYATFGNYLWWRIRHLITCGHEKRWTFWFKFSGYLGDFFVFSVFLTFFGHDLSMYLYCAFICTCIVCLRKMKAWTIVMRGLLLWVEFNWNEMAWEDTSCVVLWIRYSTLFSGPKESASTGRLQKMQPSGVHALRSSRTMDWAVQRGGHKL